MEGRGTYEEKWGGKGGSGKTPCTGGRQHLGGSGGSDCIPGIRAFSLSISNEQNYGSLQGMEDAEQSAGKAQCVCTDRAENNQR